MADACGDIIAGAPLTLSSLDALIRICLDHENRLVCADRFRVSPDALDDYVAQGVSAGLPLWSAELTAVRVARRQALKGDSTRQKPTTVTERIRERARERLRRTMNEFLADAHPEDIRLLIEVLDGWNSAHYSQDSGYGELPLASAFERELQSNHSYMRVPDEFAAKVDAYVKSLVARTDVAE